MEKPEPQRIQKLIAQAGLCSRREAERFIENGEVRVNGKTVSLGDRALASDPIFVKNKRLHIPEAHEHVGRILISSSKILLRI